MRKDSNLAEKIRQKALKLLLDREPEEISMREIARECGVSATSLYYYYKDKETLFEEVKVDCLKDMDRFIMEKTPRGKDPEAAIRAGLGAFRDWAFACPRTAILVMGRLKANKTANMKELEQYYHSNMFGKEMFDMAVRMGISKSKDTLLDASLAIAALWGAIESILLNRTIPKYWDKGIFFTNKMIDLCCKALLTHQNREKRR
jgi:AcrR family transcriptional regulator